MRWANFSIHLLILTTVGGTAVAQDFGPKAGLWEFTVVRQVMDGRDMSEQMAAARSQMEQALANLPAEQRKKMEAAMAHQGMEASGAGRPGRMCISPAMATRFKPIVDSKGRCEPTNIKRSGDRMSFEFHCPNMVGKGESTVAGETLSTRVDMTMTDSRGTHTMLTETQMKYLGQDCQGVKPLDELAKGIKGPADIK